jgi:hypothetical protein
MRSRHSGATNALPHTFLTRSKFRSLCRQVSAPCEPINPFFSLDTYTPVLLVSVAMPSECTLELKTPQQQQQSFVLLQAFHTY